MGMYGSSGGGGDTTIDNRTYEETLKQSLEAQVAMAPQMYDMEKSQEYGKPAYAKLEREVAMDSLLGEKVPGADWQQGTEWEGFNFDEYRSNSIDREKQLQEQFDKDDFQKHLDHEKTLDAGRVWIDDRYSASHLDHYKQAQARSDASKAALTSHQEKYKEKSEGYQAARELATRYAPEHNRVGGGLVDVMAGGIEMDFTTGKAKTPKDLANQKLLETQQRVGAQALEGMGAKWENGQLVEIESGEAFGTSTQNWIMSQVEGIVGSDKSIAAAQKAFDETDGELSPEMETVNRKAGFSKEGKFLGLQALQRDMSEYDIRRQRTADVRDAKELGTSLTSAYRDQGNIRGAVQDVGTLAGTSLAGRAGITDRGVSLESKADTLAGQIGRVGQGRLTPQGYQQGGLQSTPQNVYAERSDGRTMVGRQRSQPDLSAAEQGAAAVRGSGPMASAMQGPPNPAMQGSSAGAASAMGGGAAPGNPWEGRTAGSGSRIGAAQSAGFAGSLGDATKFGLGGLRSELTNQASSELALGGDLTDRERRRLTDAASAASSARGRNYDTKAIVDEVASMDQASLARKGMRQGFAQGVAGQEGQLQEAAKQRDLTQQENFLGREQQRLDQGMDRSLQQQQGYLQREQQRIESGINRALQAGQSELAADLQSQLANIGIQQTNMNAQMGAAGLDVARDVSLQQVNEQLYRQGIGQEFGMATNRVGIEQATSSDPYLAVAGRATGAGVAQGSNMYNQGMGTNAQGYNTQIYDPSAGLGYMMNQQNNQTSLAAANIGANSRQDAGMMGMFGSLGGALIGLCWVAREIFGADNPKWLQFREFMVNRADDNLREYYIEYGPSIADHLSKAGPGERMEMAELMNKILEVA